MATVIHVVDDDGSFRTSIGRLLRASGYEVELLNSAKQLLEQMPDQSGQAASYLMSGYLT